MAEYNRFESAFWEMGLGNPSGTTAVQSAMLNYLTINAS